MHFTGCVPNFSAFDSCGLARFSIAWMSVNELLNEFLFPEIFKISAVYCVYLFSDLIYNRLEKNDKFET